MITTDDLDKMLRETDLTVRLLLSDQRVSRRSPPNIDRIIADLIMLKCHFKKMNEMDPLP